MLSSRSLQSPFSGHEQTQFCPVPLDINSITSVWGMIRMPSYIYFLYALPVYCIGWAIYARYFHPLRHVPGPRLASVSRLWYMIHLARGDMGHIKRRLRVQRGPLFRIALDEITYAPADAIQRTYRGKGAWHKTNFHSVPKYTFDAAGELSFGQMFGFVARREDHRGWIYSLDLLMPFLCLTVVAPSHAWSLILGFALLLPESRKALKAIDIIGNAAQDCVLQRLPVATRSERQGRANMLEQLFDIYRKKDAGEDFQVDDIMRGAWVAL